MSAKLTENLNHVLHVAEHTEAGRRAMHSASAAVASGLAAAIPIVGPVVIVAAPVALLGYGLWSLFGKK